MSRFDTGLLARAREFVSGLQEWPAKAPEWPATLPPELDAVDIAADLCRRFEGFRSAPYLCPAGVATIGYGTTHYANGARVLMTDPPMTREAANGLLLRHLRGTCLPALLRACPGLRDEAPARVGALLDWTYNLGAGHLASSTLRRRVNAGEWDRVPGELRRWVYGGGVRLAGLVARREAEATHVVMPMGDGPTIRRP